MCVFGLAPATRQQRQRQDDAHGAQHRRDGEGALEPVRQRGRQRRATLQRAGHAAVRHRGQDRQAKRATDLLGGVEQPRRQAGIAGHHAVRGRDSDRHERHPQTRPEHEHGRQDVTPVVAMTRDACEEQEAGGRDGEAGDEHRLGREAVDEA